MDWGLVISGVLGLLAGGGASWIFKIKQDKASAEGDALAKYGDVIEKLLGNVSQQQETFNNIIEQKDLTIEQQAKLLDEYKCSLEEANRKIKKFEYMVKENDRKITGMQKVIDEEVGKKRFAEDNICFVEDCKLRKPPKNTYGKESA